MARDALQRLHDIVDACRLIQRLVQDLDEDAFLQSPLHQSAVAYQFVIIGEATPKPDEQVRVENPQVPWADMAGLRVCWRTGISALTGASSGAARPTTCP